MPASEPFSLLDHSWLPVLRKSGPALIRPAEITSRLAGDPVLAFDWWRADFDAAAREFLIGLLSTACWQKVSDKDEWEDWWRTPPDPATLDACFAPFREAFVLDGPGPRFLQDREDLITDQVPVGGLLMDIPGLFIKRGRIEALSRASTAMALFTLQNFAPAGGRGHRTSLRGGGPMVTLVLPDEREEPVPLWRTLWLNTFWDEDWPEPEGAELPRIFPWLTRTRTSEAKGAVTTPDHVHPAQAFWGMPRRIRLDFTPDEAGRCDLTGEEDGVVVRSYRTRPSGTNYAGWQHPLTPYYKTKPTDLEWLPVHPQPERLGYRHWLGLIVPSDDKLRRPATIVATAEHRLLNLRIRHSKLWAAGYDMDNMKPRGFVESEMPLLLVANPAWHADFDAMIRELIDKARDTASLLGSTVRQALWGNEAPSADKGDRKLADERFWARTEAPFLAIVTELAAAFEQAGHDEARVRAAQSEARERWREATGRHALAIFDELVPLEVIEEQRVMERRIAARRRLVFGLREPAAGTSKSRGRKAA